MLTYRIAEKDHCRRVESFLQNLLPAAPLSYLRKLVRSGSFLLNGTLSSPDDILRISDTVSLKESSRLSDFSSHVSPEMDILFEDSWIMVLNKPPGMAVHRAAEVESDNLVEEAGRFVRARDALGGKASNHAFLKLRPVNRLDRGTSGAIILAKSPSAAGMFGRMIKEEGFGKLYLAVVEGELPVEGSITAPVEGKESETTYQRLFQGKGAALAAVHPLTGRMHQIRQHLKLDGHPIVGDKRYGGRPLPEYAGHALHSFLTVMTHPATGKELRIFAPLPQELAALISGLAGDFYDRLVRSLPEIR